MKATKKQKGTRGECAPRPRPSAQCCEARATRMRNGGKDRGAWELETRKSAGRISYYSSRPYTAAALCTTRSTAAAQKTLIRSSRLSSGGCP